MTSPIVPHLTVAEIAARYNMSDAKVQAVFDRAQLAMKPWTKEIQIIENGENVTLTVTRKGVGILVNQYGKFWQYDFSVSDCWEKYSVLVHCDTLDERLMPFWANPRKLTMRTDSGCETGQVFHDATCECREQLHMAMKELVAVGEGMIVNIPRQDGRGKGLPFKLATLLLQDQLGVNTVESASMLAKDGRIDVRTYAGVIAVLKFFGITNNTEINLATNNPFKMHVFYENGMNLAGTTPMIIKATEHTARHLAAKHDHLGHTGIGIDLDGDGTVDVVITKGN